MLKTFNFAEWLSEGGNAGMRNFALNLSYEQMCWVRACVNRVATSASTAPLNFYEGTPGQLPTYKEEERILDREHPVYKLFNPPKPPVIISLKQLMYRTFIHEQIDGLVFWLIERKKRMAESIDIRTKDELRPVIEYKGNDQTRGVLVGWEDSSQKRYLPEDVLPIGNYDPKNQLGGLSLLKAARISLESEYSIAGWNSSFFKTGMKSPLLIQAKGQLTKEQKSEIRKEIVNYYSGVEGGHGALVMQGSVEVKPLTVNPKDIDFIRGKELNREEILAVFGVPPALVGIYSYSNYSNVREQIRIFWEHTLLPKMNYILELLQFNILDRDFPGVYAAWDLSKVVGLAPDPVELAAPANIYKGMGYSPSQVSRILNCPLLEPDEDFDEDATPASTPAAPPAPDDDGDPSASDPEKPDNNNSLILQRLLTTFAQNAVDLSARQIMLLWEDVVICFLKELNPEFPSHAWDKLPKLLCRANNGKMVQEFISQTGKMSALLLSVVGTGKVNKSEESFRYFNRSEVQPVINLHTTVNLPEGMVKAEPVEIILQEREPAKVTVHVQQAEQPAPVVNFYAEKSDPPVVNLAVSVPEQKVPDIHVTVPEQKAPEVIVNLPEQKAPEVIVNLPEQKAPDIHVTVPEQKAPEVIVNLPEQKVPDIHVTVPEQKAPEVIVHLPESQPVINLEVPVTPEIKVDLGTRKTVTDIIRDANGQISQATQVESSID